MSKNTIKLGVAFRQLLPSSRRPLLDFLVFMTVYEQRETYLIELVEILESPKQTIADSLRRVFACGLLNAEDRNDAPRAEPGSGRRFYTISKQGRQLLKRYGY